VRIGRGENGGRVLDYTNIVLASDAVVRGDGDTQNISLDVEEARKLGADHVAAAATKKWPCAHRGFCYAGAPTSRSTGNQLHKTVLLGHKFQDYIIA